ncbi:Carboxypeptidase A4 like protein [Argiope bruennichi]|uniref:Carboxypeptidase A4 like protein n=1 Tax=Argiope bruennichi TaxID=94029 RepID=A0A8T0FBC7_ARGBR|nr:Carboxypeptidase A4 like protein [Argiope bruennichi]
MSSFNICSCNPVCYDGYSLLRITPTTEKQLKCLLDIHSKYPEDLVFWLRTSAVNHSADLMVEPKIKALFIKQLASLRMPYKVLIPDIGKIIKEENVTPEERAKLGFFEVYRSFVEIDHYIEDLAYRFPECVSLIPYGLSSEGRTLQLLRISSNPTERKPAIWIQGGTHAREFISPATVIYIATKLACLCEKENEESYELLNSFDWYILPLMNPDGYDYAQNTDRLWRKTRSRYPNAENCVGVDPNRNWDIKWSDASGASLRPCSDFYAGPTAFSEPETRSISDFMLDNLKGRLILFLDVHSYSQKLSYPYGYTTELPSNFYEQRRLAEVAIRAMESVNGTKFTTGSTEMTTYTITGSTRDWVFDVMCPKYAYVLELRDKGRFGFLLPTRFILPTAKETWEGVKAIGFDLAEKLYYDSYFI